MTPSAAAATMPLLSVLYEEFQARAATAGFVGLEIMPILMRAQQSGVFHKTNIATMLHDRDDTRAPGGAFTRISGTRSEDTYATVDRGLEEPLDNRTMRAEPWIDHEMLARDRLLVAMMAAHERRVVAKALDGGLASAAGGNWTSSSATPIKDVEDGKQVFRTRTGYLPNLLVIPWKRWSDLRKHNAEIRDLLKYTNAKEAIRLAPQILAELFDIERVVLAGGLRNSAAQGQTPSLAEIWDATKAGLYRVDASGSQDSIPPQFGRTIAFSGNPESGGAIGFRPYEEEQTDSRVIRSRWDTDEKVFTTGFAQIISGLEG